MLSILEPDSPRHQGAHDASSAEPPQPGPRRRDVQPPGPGRRPGAAARTIRGAGGTQRLLSPATHDLEARRIADLDALAARSTGPEADAAYRELFTLAIGRRTCAPKPSRLPADAWRRPPPAGTSTPWPGWCRCSPMAEKNDHEQALADWKALIHRPANQGQPPAQPGHSPRSPWARRTSSALSATADTTSPASCASSPARTTPRRCLGAFPGPAGPAQAARQARAADRRQGRRWPPGVPRRPQGQGRPGGFLGDVVPALRRRDPRECAALVRKYEGQGLVILGVQRRPDARGRQGSQAGPVGRPQVPAPSPRHLDQPDQRPGGADIAAAYGVEEIPANFLIDRDGKIIALEQTGEALERAIVARPARPGRRPSQVTCCPKTRRQLQPSSANMNRLGPPRRPCRPSRPAGSREVPAMTSRRGRALVLALLLAIGPAASGRARAQFGVASGPGYPSVGYPSVSYPSVGYPSSAIPPSASPAGPPRPGRPIRDSGRRILVLRL